MNLKKLYLLIFFLVIGLTKGYSTPKPPGGGMGPPCWPGPCSIPIDGGVTFLLAAGAALGAKKIADARKNKN